MDTKGIGFLILWVAVTLVFAWFCFDRLSAARETGRFRYAFHGISQENWPLLFKFCKGFITVQAYGFCLMAGIGAIWLAVALIGKLR